MSVPSITFFPVSNGDMALLEVESGALVLIDINIREPKDGVRDVSADLRKRLKTDAQGRPYVDAMVLSHPDEDHCRGLVKHFHLGPLDEYDKEADELKIIIREMWSSPLIFRRASTNHKLSEDAKAWDKEARRRVKLFRKNGVGQHGDRILVLGEDRDGKTDDLGTVLVRVGDTVTKIAGAAQTNFSALLLGPELATDDADEDLLSKNDSSVVFNYKIGVGATVDAVKFLSAGDAEVVIWERLWAKHKNSKADLEYDLLGAPHHCSWHSLSYDSWSEKRRKAEVSTDARKALAQTRRGAIVVASSDIIKDDDNDPPCIRAKEEYVAIATEAKGEFMNTAEFPNSKAPEPMTFTVTAGGLGKPTKKSATSSAAAGIAVFSSQPRQHGSGQ